MAKNMGTLKKVLIMTAVVIAIALITVLNMLSDMGHVGTGYASKIMCSSVFVAGRDPADVEQVDLQPTKGYPISVKVDREKKQVTASLFGLYQNRAVYRGSLGCTLAVLVEDEDLYAHAAVAPKPLPPLSSEILWPLGSKVDTENLPPNVDKKKLGQALEFAFTDQEPDFPIGTRAVAVVYKGELIAERYAPGFTKDTPLLGWSMTKSITNALIGILVQQGKLDIYAPAPVPEWQDPVDPRSRITTDQLLRMSSGLAFIEEYEENITSDCNLMLFTKRNMASFAANMPLIAEPDSVWSYSSGTTNILSRIVRHTLGGTLQDYFNFPRKELFGKLGMSSAVLEPDPSGTFVGSSNSYATARDWARFGLLFLNDGVWNNERILPKGWVKYCTTPTPKAPGGEYGAQFWLNAGDPQNPEDRWMPEIPIDAYSARGHDGQYVTILPSQDLVIVRLGFTPDHKKHWDHQRFIKMVMEAL